MAEAFMAKRAPMVVATAMLAAATHDKGRLTDPKRLQFKVRIAKMLEEMAETAVIREAEMQDRTELGTLDGAIHGIRSGDTVEALRVLEERRLHLLRRKEMRTSERASESSDDECNEEENNQDLEEKESVGASDHALLQAGRVQDGMQAQRNVPSMEAGLGLHTLLPLDTAPFWTELVEGGLHVQQAARSSDRASDFGERLPEYLDMLHRDGYVQSDAVLEKVQVDALLAGMRRLRDKGWPPVFVFMFDEAWEVVHSVWDCAEELLGGQCVLEPSFTAFMLSYQMAQKDNKYVGTNFGLPHRDYTYAESHAADGSPQLLSVWVPLNNATVDNGCMYVVPREFDPNFQRDHQYEHKQCVTHGALKNLTFLNFALNGVRPLPAAAGSISAWHSNLIHWGSNCSHRGRHDPRASLAFVFRRCGSTPDMECPPLRRHEIVNISIRRRLYFITRALSYFKHWYTMPDHLKNHLAVYEQKPPLD